MIIGAAAVIVVLLCVALAIASFSFENYYAKLQELDQMRNTAGANTLQYVDAINKTYFGGHLKIERCAEFEDHYSSGRVALSEQTMYSNSLASLAIVSHELGHARQDTTNTLRKHWKLRRSGRRCGLFFLPVMVVGIVLSVLWVFGVLPQIFYIAIGGGLLGLGLVIFIFAIVLKYKEIQIEKEASDFALEYLSQVLTEYEVKKCQELLNQARLTYWASLIRVMLSWTMLTRKEKMFK